MKAKRAQAAAGPADADRASMSRRSVLGTGAALAAGAALISRSTDALAAPGASAPARGYLPVVVPNGSKLPWRLSNGVKVFRLVAQEVEHEFAPGLKATCWGYNGQVHGPLLEAVEGDRIRVYVTNRLPAATTVHWHGFLLPNGMDGVGGLNQRTIRPGETYKYEITLRQSGTLLYHSHHDEMTQMALGLTGMAVIHPKVPAARVDRDFAILLHEWRLNPGARRPDPSEMVEFNLLTMNAKAFPGTDPLVAKRGQRIRIRFGNLSAMDHHPMHLHGHHFAVTETDAGPIAKSAQWTESSVIVPVGSTRTVELVANEPGDWALHCHMTHHVMNQMGHGFPNMVGVDPGDLDRKVRKLLPGYMTMGQTGMDMSEHLAHMKVPENSIPMVGAKGKYDYITMGGMFTLLKVRDALTTYADPGWYENPAGTQASLASPDDLRRDGVDPDAPGEADVSALVRSG